MLLIIDNYDSFTYNLYNYFLRLCIKTKVINRDKITVNLIEEINPDYIVLSPGPGRPWDDNILYKLIDKFKENKKILGVCLGHQAIGTYFGAKLIKAKKPMHGIVDFIYHDKKGVYEGLENPLEVTRYHSLILTEDNFPHSELLITAKTKNGEIMGLRHKFYNIEGIQFHPESIATKYGIEMLRNFIEGA